jgi:hypothetical protein
MATKMTGVSGSYDKSTHDSGDGSQGGSAQSKSKFSNPIQKPTDDRKKPSQKANEPKTISEHRSRP